MVYTYLKYNGLIRCMSFLKDLLIIIRLIFLKFVIYKVILFWFSSYFIIK